MKRKRELALQDKQRRKFTRRVEKNEDRPTRLMASSDEDPDIAHIVPGPQPLPWDDQGLAPQDMPPDAESEHAPPGAAG